MYRLIFLVLVFSLYGEGYRVILEPQHETSFTPQVLSPVQKIHKRMGDAFKEGETLLQLDPTIFAAIYDKAKATLEKAKVDLEAKQRLYEDNTASFLEFKEAEAAVKIAEAEVRIARKNLEATKILAPYKGKVSYIYIEEYELPQQDKPMLDVVDDETLIGRILIPSSLAPKLQIGDPVTLTVADSSEKLKGAIKRMGPVIDPASSTLTIEIEMDNREHKLIGGMSGLATFDKLVSKGGPLERTQSR